MANQYHDAEGKFCSKNAMSAAVDKLRTQGNWSAFSKLKEEYDTITRGNDAEQQALFPITNDTLGKIITDPDHVRWIQENADDYVPSENNPYLQPENSVYLKEITEDGYTEVAILDEDSVPILSTSFNHMDGFHPGDEPVKRAAFIARTNGAAFGVPPTEEQVAEASRLYDAFKANGGKESFDINLLNRTRQWMTSMDGDAKSYFTYLATQENSERRRKAGKKSSLPSQEDQNFVVRVFNSLK